MKTMPSLHVLRFAALILFGSLSLRAHGSEAAPLSGEKAIAHLKTTGNYESLAAAVTGARYAVKPVEDRAGDPKPSELCAQNPAQGLNSTFTPEGLTFTVRAGEGADTATHTVGWRLRSLGYGAAQTPVPAGTLSATLQRVELTRTTPAITEWFQNEPGGLEHGFTVPERPAANTHGEPLRVVLSITGDLTPQADGAGQSLALCDAAGKAVLSYARLKVWDATGTELSASMRAAKDEVTFTVEDATASYPLTIDPTFVQQAYLKASNTGANDSFGSAIAISGDTVVVGAPLEDSNATGVNGTQSDNAFADSGAAYVFVRNGGAWSQQAYLKASNTEANDNFGVSVAISGDTLVIGASQEDSNATGVNGDGANNSAANSGAAYVFVRSGTTWSQQAYLKASNTGAGDLFGYSVAIAGDTVLIGAYQEDSNAIGVNGDGANNSAANSGAAYVFIRSGSTWSQQAYFKASNTDALDTFGYSVGVSGDIAVVGAWGEDSSASGVNGNQSDNSVGATGAAYVFARSGSTWVQQAYLKASSSGFNDFFGYSVAVSGNTVVVGAYREQSNAMGVNGNDGDNSLTAAGAAYVFVQNGATWTQQAYLKASNTESNDSFGVAVAISGDKIAVSASGEDSNATGVNGNQGDNNALNSGAAYLFARNGSTWSQQAYLKASNTEANDGFGRWIAVSGDTVAIAALSEDSNATGVNGNQSDNSATDSGAAYIYSTTPTCVAPPSGMVLWLPLDEASGTTTANLAAAGSNGTLINSPVQTAGKVSNSLAFDGTARYADVPHYAALNLGTGNFSADAWVKRDPASGNGVRVIFDKRDSSTQIGYHLVVSFGNLLLQLADSGGVTNFRDTGIIPADNQWHLAAVTVNRASANGGRFYVDGVATGTFDPTPRSGSLNNTSSLQVGRSPLGGNSPWLGGIDELEVFNRAIAASEIAAIYNAGSAGKCKCVPPPTGMTLWLPLDEATGTRTANLTGGLSGTLINSPTHTVGYVRNSLCFDGTQRYVDVPSYPAINPGTGDLSIDAWVKRDPASGTTTRIITDKRGSINGPGYGLAVSFGNLIFSQADSTGLTNHRDTGIVPADNEWHLVGVTVDRTSATGGRFYVDGIATGTFDPTVRPGSLSTANSFQVGRSPWGGNIPWFGCIDEVEVFNRALAANEIAAIYNARNAGKCKNTFGGLNHVALGQAILGTDPVNGGLLVSNIGSSGEDGVSLNLGMIGPSAAEGFSWTIEMPEPVAIGATLRTFSMGQVDGVPDTLIGAQGVTRVAAGLQILPPDFSGSGAASYNLRVYNYGSLVYSQNGMTGSPGTLLAGSKPKRCHCSGLHWWWYIGKNVPTDRASVALTGGPTLEADRIDFEANAPTHTLDFYTSTSAKASGMASFTVTEELMTQFGVPHQAVGNAVLEPSNNGLLVTNLGSSGQDGVSMELGHALSTDISWMPLDLTQPSPLDAWIQLDFKGSVNGVPDQSLGRARVTHANNNANGYVITADLTPLNSPTQRVEVWRQGTQLAVFTGQPAGVVGFASNWPTGGGKTGLGTSNPFILSCIRTDWPLNTTILVNGTSFVADQLLILQEGTPSVNYLSGISVTAADIPQIAITGEQTVLRLPVITSPVNAIAVVGGVFSYQIIATNFPDSYAAFNLPAGLALNTATGLISGTPTVAGTSIVLLAAIVPGGTGNLSLTLEVQSDADADGMGDAWEAANGLNNTVNDAAADRDGDGRSNLAEWLAGTLPNNPASRFEVSNSQRVNGDFVLTWRSVVGKRYRVFTRTDLVSGTWMEITPAPIVATGPVTSFTHTGGGVGAQRYYRVGIAP